MTINPFASVSEDFERFRNLIDVATVDMIPDSGDRSHHVAELSAEIVRLDPQLFGTVSALLSTGDVTGAVEAAKEGLDRFSVAFPNALVATDPTKALARLVYSKFMYDRASAVAMADRDDIHTVRRQCRLMADQMGVKLADLMDEAREQELHRQTLLAEAEAERQRRSDESRQRNEDDYQRSLVTPLREQHRARRII